MTKNKTFGVVSWFAGSSLKDLAINFLNESWKSIGNKDDDVVDWDGADSTIPLFICERRDALKRSGLLCPHALIIERCDFLPTVDSKGTFTSRPVCVMATRLSVLKKLYGSRLRKDFLNYMRDWLAGSFRMYLMLDATTHGTSEFVDIEKVKEGKDPILMALAGSAKEAIVENCFARCSEEDRRKRVEEAKNHAEVLRHRFTSTFSADDASLKFKPYAEQIFPEYFEEWDDKSEKAPRNVKRSIVRALGLSIEGDILSSLGSIYCEADKLIDKECGVIINKPLKHNERLPVAFGDRAKFVTPSGKLNLLLIDDNVEESPFAHLNEDNAGSFAHDISEDDWNLMRAIFSVKLQSVDKRDGDVYKVAVQRFREFHNDGLTFDLILVDLCLGNNVRGADLDGYAMIRIVKVFFPGTPIVVYSRFSDMEHIARAFSCGAKWFLVKGEEAKLPRHVLKLLKQVGWHREWRSVRNSSQAPEFLFEKQDGFTCRFNRTEEWKYLTYKSLEYFPGKFIAVKKMGGGISSAVTFKATKGVKLGEDFLQTPCIIKIDTSYNTMMEFERYFRMIRPYIANECGRVEMPERVLNRTYSSIVYTFAGKQDQAHTLESMGDMLDDNVVCQTACDYETYRYALKCIFDEILPKIHRVSPELELADIGKPSASPSEVMDAFKWKWEDKSERESSFPNYYFSEFKPSEFWKSYMLRMQPWGRVAIKFEKTWPFESQEAPEQEAAEQETSEPKKRQRLIFHNVMTEPFARLDDAKEDRRKKAGRRIIEAYTDDRRLVWLEGDACDFVARFRKRVSPGTSLWVNGDACFQLGEIDRLPEEDESADQSKQDAVALSNKNGRLCWLNDTLKYKSTGDKDATAEFVRAITNLLGIRRASAKERAGSRNIEDLGFYITLQDAVLGIARQASAKADEWNMKCPVGIVHGDLNVKNIMLESRKHPPREDDPDVTKKVSDVWLIDFARTRRDIIAHDFNVFFTSVLGEFFTEGLIGKEDKEKSAHQKDYWEEKLVSNFRTIVTAAVAPESKSEKGVPDEIKDDKRFMLIYRILRRTHDAARTAGVSQNMYLLSTALACLYTLKIFLNNGCKVRLAAGYFAAAWICYDLLCEAIDIDNKMEGDTRVEVANTSVPTEMTGGATE